MLFRSQLSTTPGVIHLKTFFSYSNFIVLIFDHLHGYYDLYHYRQKTPLNIPEINLQYIFIQLVNTLVWCKNKQVLHGDIKDENILFHPFTLHTILIDFNAAETWEDDTQYYHYRGTKIFAPPEWFSNQCFTADNLTVYQCGALLYTLQIGRAHV